jgi:hypothetical protein
MNLAPKYLYLIKLKILMVLKDKLFASWIYKYGMKIWSI